MQSAFLLLLPAAVSQNAFSQVASGKNLASICMTKSPPNRYFTMLLIKLLRYFDKVPSTLLYTLIWAWHSLWCCVSLNFPIRIKAIVAKLAWREPWITVLKKSWGVHDCTYINHSFYGSANLTGVENKPLPARRWCLLCYPGSLPSFQTTGVWVQGSSWTRWNPPAHHLAQYQ